MKTEFEKEKKQLENFIKQKEIELRTKFSKKEKLAQIELARQKQVINEQLAYVRQLTPIKGDKTFIYIDSFHHWVTIKLE
ncbi:hypothetical protein RFI_07590 [Reticulomyxa filosa]|uniref:Uncharacterized protein n=1 Tax=Reticulomyxa filosa TaxID=46433 RepID=X6NUR2_RETFI|nr:hypothetical protein RFI_07590 [Reticulomyxa filosa]|eukprot:ETO29529.1 hypothetical protein RFI_07590 [Reticulomyxa filosa]